MLTKSVVVCLACDTTLILPEDPGALAVAVTDFVETHNRMQHWKFDLIPPSGTADGQYAASAGYELRSPGNPTGQT